MLADVSIRGMTNRFSSHLRCAGCHPSALDETGVIWQPRTRVRCESRHCIADEKRAMVRREVDGESNYLGCGGGGLGVPVVS